MVAGVPRDELNAVINTAQSLDTSGQLTSSRLTAVELTLRRRATGIQSLARAYGLLRHGGPVHVVPRGRTARITCWNVNRVRIPGTFSSGGASTSAREPRQAIQPRRTTA
jgi:hypothetical protein